MRVVVTRVVDHCGFMGSTVEVITTEETDMGKVAFNHLWNDEQYENEKELSDLIVGTSSSSCVTIDGGEVTYYFSNLD